MIEGLEERQISDESVSDDFRMPTDRIYGVRVDAFVRRNLEKGLPSGSEQFIKIREWRAGRVLTYLPPGRPEKKIQL